MSWRIAYCLLLIAYCLPIALHAQNWTTVSASNITDLNQQKLAAGRLCFLITDVNDNPISVMIGGGGQSLQRPYCSTVTTGAAASFTVPNPATTAPANIAYRVAATDSSTGQTVLHYTNVQFTGTTFNFDNYVPSPPLPLGSSVSVLTVGTLTIVGSCAGCTSSTITQRAITGTINGSNTIFTLPSSPPAGGLLLLENGLMQTSGAGNDYTITGNTITFAIAPAIGAALLAFY